MNRIVIYFLPSGSLQFVVLRKESVKSIASKHFACASSASSPLASVRECKFDEKGNKKGTSEMESLAFAEHKQKTLK